MCVYAGRCERFLCMGEGYKNHIERMCVYMLSVYMQVHGDVGE